MMYIDPHIHTSSRTTDDYEAMQQAGVVAVIEPAFWMGQPREANNEALAEEVMELLPLFLSKEGVVAVGEIGYDDQTPLEDKYFREQLELAREMDMPVMVHTPHRDKKAGTSRSMDVCEEHGLAPSKVVIDHNNEETV